MRERIQQSLTEQETRLQAAPFSVQVYVRLGQSIETTDDPKMQASIREQRWNILDKMTEGSRAALYSYENYLQDQIRRKNGGK